MKSLKSNHTIDISSKEFYQSDGRVIGNKNLIKGN